MEIFLSYWLAHFLLFVKKSTKGVRMRKPSSKQLWRTPSRAPKRKCMFRTSSGDWLVGKELDLRTYKPSFIFGN
jgi:hypothetical protein